MRIQGGGAFDIVFEIRMLQEREASCEPKPVREQCCQEISSPASRKSFCFRYSFILKAQKYGNV